MSSNPAPTFRVRQIVASKEDKESLLKLEGIPEISDIENILAAAFDEDVFTATVIGMEQVGSSRELIGPFWKSTVIAGLLAGEVYVAETPDTQKIVGCTVWFGPNHIMYGTKEEQEMVLGPLLGMLGKSVSDWWMTEFLPGYGRFTETAFGQGKKHASWHLQTLAVHPDHQRRGAAKQLVEIITKKAASDKSMMVVECGTDINTEIYKRLGFKIMHEGTPITDLGMKDDYAETFKGIHALQCKLWAMGRNPLA
ncbi:hypothetical protein L208DRAFT_1375528 [Tricholoma matsutake]|nr:hypothetical protein L208DRAFT_1375528 [Tricholoma matsutake 945]